MSKQSHSSAHSYFDSQFINQSWNSFIAKPTVASKLETVLDRLSVDNNPQQLSKLSLLQCVLYKYLAVGTVFDSNINKLLEQYLQVLAAEAIANQQKQNVSRNNNNSKRSQKSKSLDTKQYLGKDAWPGVLFVLQELTQDTVRMVKITGWSAEKRKTLLLRLLPLIVNCTDFHIEKLLKCLLGIVNSLKYTEEQLLLLIEEMAIQGVSSASAKVKTIEGPLICSASYLFISLLQNYVNSQEIAHNKSKQVFERLQQIASLLSNTLVSLIENMSGDESGNTSNSIAKSSRDFVHNILKDSYSLTSFLQFPLSLRITKELTAQLVGYYANQTDPKISTHFMPLLSSMLVKLLKLRNSLPEVQIEQIQQQEGPAPDKLPQIVECINCNDFQPVSEITTYVLKHRQLQTHMPLCSSCLIQASNLENSINLLPLVLANKRDVGQNFELQQVSKAKKLYLLEIVPDLNKNIPRLEGLLQRLGQIEQRQERKNSQKGMDKLCLVYLNYSCERLGLKGQLRSLFSYWIVESDAPQYYRRVRALKEVGISLKSLFTMEPNAQIDFYKQKVLRVVQTRFIDLNQNVRLESIRALFQIIGTDGQGKLEARYVDLLTKRLTDQSVAIRKFLLNYFEKHPISIINGQAVQQIEGGQQLQNAIVDKVFGELVSELVFRLQSDQFSSIRTLALSALKTVLFSSSDHKIKKNNKQTNSHSRKLVNMLFSHQHSQNFILALIPVCKEVSSSLLKEAINQILARFKQLTDNKQLTPEKAYSSFLFLEHLSKENSSCLAEVFGKLVVRASQCFETGLHALGAGYTRVLSRISWQTSHATKKENQQAQRLLKLLEDVIHSPSQGYMIKDCLKLFVKLKIGFEMLADVEDLLNKCERYLEYSCHSQYFSKAQASSTLSDSQLLNGNPEGVWVACILQSLMMCTVICLEKQVHHQNPEQLRRVYERIAQFLQCTRPSVQNRSLQCLAQFWAFNHRIFYLSWSALEAHLPGLLTNSPENSVDLAILTYECLLARIDQCIANQTGCDNSLILVSNLFSKTFQSVFGSPRAELRKLALNMILKLHQTGMINMFDYTKHLLAYVCDTDEIVREQAIKFVLLLEERILYTNFFQNMGFCLKYVIHNYGEITAVSGVGVQFFGQLIAKSHTIPKPTKKGGIKKSPIRHAQTSFIKKVGEILTDCPADELDYLEFCCCILNECKTMTQDELDELRNGLSSIIQIHYHQVITALMRLRRQQRNSKDKLEQSRQNQADLDSSDDDYEEAMPNNNTSVSMIRKSGRTISLEKAKAACLFKMLVCYRRLVDLIGPLTSGASEEQENTQAQNSKASKHTSVLPVLQIRKYQTIPEPPKSTASLYKQIKALYRGESIDQEEPNQDCLARSGLRQKKLKRAARKNAPGEPDSRHNKKPAKSAPKKGRSRASPSSQKQFAQKEGSSIQMKYRMKLRNRSKTKHIYIQP